MIKSKNLSLFLIRRWFGIILLLFFQGGWALLPPKKLEELSKRYNEALLLAKAHEFKKAEKILLSLLKTYGNS